MQNIDHDEWTSAIYEGILHTEVQPVVFKKLWIWKNGLVEGIFSNTMDVNGSTPNNWTNAQLLNFPEWNTCKCLVASAAPVKIKTITWTLKWQFIWQTYHIFSKSMNWRKGLGEWHLTFNQQKSSPKGTWVHANKHCKMTLLIGHKDFCKSRLASG